MEWWKARSGWQKVVIVIVALWVASGIFGGGEDEPDSGGEAAADTTTTTALDTTTSQPTTTTPPSTSPSTTVPGSFLDMSTDEVADRWNAAAIEVGSDRRIRGELSSRPLESGGTALQWDFDSETHLEVVAYGNRIHQVTLLGAASDDELSNTMLVVDLVTWIITVDPELQPESRGEIIEELIQLNDDGTIETETIRNGIRYSMTGFLGVLVASAEPVS